MIYRIISTIKRNETGNQHICAAARGAMIGGKYFMKKTKRNNKSIARIVAVLLSVCLAVQGLPLEAFASETESIYIEEQQTEQTAKGEKAAQEEQPEETVQGADEEEHREEALGAITSAEAETAEQAETGAEEIVEKNDDITESASSTGITSETLTEVAKEEIAAGDESETENEMEEEISEDSEAMYEEYLEEFYELMDELSATADTYKITEKQLFMQAPQYLLKDNPRDEYLSRCFKFTRQVMDNVSDSQELWAAFMKGLKDGKEILTRELASQCGLKDSNYDKEKKDMAGELVREYMGNEEYLSDKAEIVSKGFSQLEKISDAELKGRKEWYKKQLKKHNKYTSNAEIDAEVDTIFDHWDKIQKFTGEAIDVYDLITAIIARQELELAVIDDLIVSLQDSRDTDLLEGLVMVRNDITSDIGSYILENYLTDKAIEKMRDIALDALEDGLGSLIGVINCKRLLNQNKHKRATA